MANRIKTVKKSPDPGKLTAEKEEKVVLRDVVKDERTRKITGAVLLMLCFFFLVAFTSYLFTWKEDQDKVFQHGISILAPNEYPIANLLGAFGAYISHLFFYKGFGVASYLFCSFLFVVGANLLFNRKIFSVARNIKYLVSGLLVFSLSFAFVFRNSEFHWGGEVGNQISRWCIGLIGNLGTGVLILVAFLSYMIWRFNPVFNVPKLKLPERKAKEEEEDVEEMEDDKEVEAVPLKGNRLKKNKAPLVIDEEVEEEVEETPFSIIEKQEPIAPVMQEPVPAPLPVQEPEHVKYMPPVSSVDADGLKLEIKTAEPEVEEEALTGAEKVAKLPPYDPILDLRDYKFPK
ncbi:MAG TPA: DNA translocase FtsK 4TM domain-containing protein, partial [Chitinophagaceae bacterium]|nr:DNA translocase FtsK 4TM domain-containing protein [Chitinophagaceae bacterium]